MEDGHYTYLPLFEPDIELQDGDTITLGNTCIRAVAVPGHTMGVMAYFFEVEENGTKQLAGLYGGIGLNTMCRDFQEKYHVPEYRENYLSSLEKVRYEPVTITLGNHTSQTHTLEKLAKRIENPNGPNPFVDPAEWERFIEQTKQRYMQMLDEEQAETDQV